MRPAGHHPETCGSVQPEERLADATGPAGSSVMKLAPVGPLTAVSHHRSGAHASLRPAAVCAEGPTIRYPAPVQIVHLPFLLLFEYTERPASSSHDGASPGPSRTEGELGAGRRVRYVGGFSREEARPDVSAQTLTCLDWPPTHGPPPSTFLAFLGLFGHRLYDAGGGTGCFPVRPRIA